MPSILVDISAHGFGHLSQSLAVLEQLAAQRADLDFVIRSGHARAVVEARCPVPFEYISEAVDVGQVMINATTPDLQATLGAYRELHADWEKTVDEAARHLEAVGPDLVLADVPYLSLAAAARVGIPGIALCSLNWADIFAAYHPGETRIHAQMREAYAAAERIIQVSPHMPMEDLDNTVRVGPIGRSAFPRRVDLDAALGIAHGNTVVLVSLGGIPFDLPIRDWPSVEGLHWIIDHEPPPRPDVHSLESTGMGFHQALASVDALVIKLSYGLCVEAALAKRPILYVRRGHFPDEPSILEWIEGRIPASEISIEQLLTGELERPLRELLAQPPGVGARATGAREAAEIVLGYL
jgi:hypothetical protein